MGNKLKTLSEIISEIQKELYSTDKENFEEYYFELERKLIDLLEIYEIVLLYVNGILE